MAHFYEISIKTIQKGVWGVFLHRGPNWFALFHNVYVIIFSRHLHLHPVVSRASSCGFICEAKNERVVREPGSNREFYLIRGCNSLNGESLQGSRELAESGEVVTTHGILLLPISLASVLYEKKNQNSLALPCPHIQCTPIVRCSWPAFLCCPLSLMMVPSLSSSSEVSSSSVRALPWREGFNFHTKLNLPLVGSIVY